MGDSGARSSARILSTRFREAIINIGRLSCRARPTAQHDTSQSRSARNRKTKQASRQKRSKWRHFERVKAELKQQAACASSKSVGLKSSAKNPQMSSKTRSPAREEDEIPYGESNVHNAGMVIIAPYIQRLFSILELTKNNAFVDENAAQQSAVHLLQYVVTGETSTPEYQLALNKLLCGIHGGLPIVAGIDLSERMNYWLSKC